MRFNKEGGGKESGAKYKKRIILVTDGDKAAGQAIRVAAKNVGARCISMSIGNPTVWTGEELVKMIKDTPYDPVVVMFDDRGVEGKGPGEDALQYVVKHPDIQVLGILAVASNIREDRVKVDYSVTRGGWLIPGPVGKDGNYPGEYYPYLHGDTVAVLNHLDVPVIVGIGDIGKLDGADDCRKGAPLTTRAFEFILNRSGGSGTSRYKGCEGKYERE